MKYGSLSSNDESIKHDGTMLAKADIKYEDIKYDLSFDVNIELASGTNFKGRISLTLPSRKYYRSRNSKL